MKIAILSREPKTYSTHRLKEACEKRGHDVKVLDTFKFSIFVEKGNPHLYYRNKPVPQFDAIIPRIGASLTFFGAAVVRQFEQMGVFSLNSALSITISRDKLRATQILCKHKIGMPMTAFVRSKEAIMPAIEHVSNDSVIIKLLEGTQGVGVILADTKKVAEAIIETFQSTKQNVLIQRFVQESEGKDIRAFVVGGKVIAAMRRIAKKGEFRSNVHRGGSIEPIKLTAEYERAAIRATQIIGLNVAGVDMMETKEGPLLLEVNSSPGLEGIEAASKLDIAASVIEYLEQRVLLPDVDVRQRLTLNSGYGVAEIPVQKGSELINKKVRETHLRNREVMIMNIVRGESTIPIPKGDAVLLEGDILLCFGKLDTLKALIPKKPSKQRKTSKGRKPDGRKKTRSKKA